MMRNMRLCCLIQLLLICQITMAREPTLTLMPTEINRNLGDGVIVSCIAEVDQPDLVSSIEWRSPNGQLIPNNDDSITTLDAGVEPNKLSLFIRRFQRDHAGIYVCSATYAGNQKLKATIDVKHHVEIYFKDCESVQTPTLDTNAKIQCLATAEPPPVVEWLKDGALIESSERIITERDGIFIKEITLHDEGVYTCRAKVPKLGKIKSKDIQVEVHVLPEMTGEPLDVEVAEKEYASFQCIAKGKPPPIYTWVNKDSEILNGKEGYYVDDKTGELRILDTGPEHAGVYRCTAKNPAGEVSAEATLRVLTKPKVERFVNITTSEGGDAKMVCEVSGDPLPDAVFKKETNPEPFKTSVSEDGRIHVSQVDEDGRRIGTLHISGVERKDDGLYTCSGVSSGGETVMWGHVTVQFKPTFEDQPEDEFWSWEQEPVNLTCLATSIPNATIQWYIREQPIQEKDPNFSVLSRGPAGILRVHPLIGSYYDTYTCKATNELGFAEHDVTLKEVQKPGPVSSAQVDEKTATTVSWNIRGPLEDGGKEVNGYTIQFRLADTSWEKSKNIFLSKGSTYVVENLTPLATYVFRFAAKNQVGNGEWSGEKSVEMPKRNVPEEPHIFNVDPISVKSIPYTDHYELQWKPPADNGEPIKYYQIIYYQVNNSTNGWDEIGARETKEVPSPGQTTYRINALKSNAYFKIELRAYNDIGFSLPSEAVIKTAYDPVSSSGNQPASSVKLSSVATPTPNNAGQEPDKVNGNAGLIVAIVIIVLLILLIIVDVILYFAKNIGLTALIVAKLAAKPSEKDKETMIEDGDKKGAKPDDNSNQELNKVAALTESSKEKEVTETTPMITGDSDKEAIKTEEKERKDEEQKSTAATNEALAKDSAV